MDVSSCISKLVKKDTPQKQAVAIALSKERKGELKKDRDERAKKHLQS